MYDRPRATPLLHISLAHMFTSSHQLDVTCISKCSARGTTSNNKLSFDIKSIKQYKCVARPSVYILSAIYAVIWTQVHSHGDFADHWPGSIFNTKAITTSVF